MLAAEGLRHHFGDTLALDVDRLDVAPGELVAVIGPNGAGKTTLLRALAGALDPDAGKTAPDPREIGWVPQQPAVYGTLTVRENLRLFAGLEGSDDPDQEVDRMLGQTALEDRADDLVSSLSGGNRQRVNIAVGMIAGPPVLLLDEPSASLDPRQRGRLWEFVTDLAAAETAVVFTTHDVAEAEHHATRVLVLVAGRITYDLPPAELHARARELCDDPDAGFETAFVALLEEAGA